MNESRKPKVLVADDMAIMRSAMKKIINSLDYEVVGEAANGQEAVDMFKSKKPDMVLLDINMPEKNGDEALKEIIAEDPDAVAIMLTSLTDMETVVQCIEIGAANYIRKDTKGIEIRNTIKETWESSNTKS